VGRKAFSLGKGREKERARDKEHKGKWDLTSMGEKKRFCQYVLTFLEGE